MLINNPSTDVWIESTPSSGVTLAYTISILQKIDYTKNFTQALCIVENNESAIQIAKRMAMCGAYKNLSIGLALNTVKGEV